MAKQVALPPKYSVPANWRWIEMGEVTFVRSGFPFNSKKFSKESNGRKPLIRIRDVVRGSTETFTDEECPDEYIIHNGDILIGMDGDFNVAKWNTGDALLNQRVCYICSSSDALLNDFLFFFLPEQLKKINAATPSVTVKHLSTKTLAKTPIPLPPLPEQQRIVERIESLFAKLDEAKEKAQAVVDGFEERKAAILHQAFTGELTKNRRAEYSIKWTKMRIGDLTDIVSSKRIFKEEYTKDGIPFFRSSEVVELYDTGYTSPVFFISQDRYREIKRVYGVPEKGDLLVTSVGTIGKTWIVDSREFYYKDGNLTQVKKCEALDMKYLQYYIMSGEFKSQVSDTVAGTAYNALTIIKFKNIRIPLPCREEQTEIVRLLDSLLDKQQQARDAAAAVLDQIDTMKKAILARAFRGELGTNDPAEESAVELVRRALSKGGETVG